MEGVVLENPGRVPVTSTNPDALLPTVCVIGLKDSGKTSVAVGLVAELTARGLRVGVVKHGHKFRLDTPGTDSYRLRHEGGAKRVVLAGPEEVAVMGEWEDDGEPSLSEVLRRFMGGVDVVVAEGYKSEAFPKIEVHRPEAHAHPLYDANAEGAELFLAVVTDNPGFTAQCPVLMLNDGGLSAALADLVQERVLRAFDVYDGSGMND